MVTLSYTGTPAEVMDYIKEEVTIEYARYEEETTRQKAEDYQTLNHMTQ